MTRIEAGQLSIELGPLAADQLVFEVIEQQLLASASLIELRSEVEPALPEVWGDRNRCLQKILENLIGNALRCRGARRLEGSLLVQPGVMPFAD